MTLKPYKILVAVMFCVGIAMLGFVYSRESLFRVGHIEIRNGSELVEARVQKQLLPLYGRPLFSVVLSELEESLVRISEIDSVRIMRIWPDRLVVDVFEKIPVALEFQKNKLLMIGSNGERISQLKMPVGRPLLENFGELDPETRLHILTWLGVEQRREMNLSEKLEMGIVDLTTLTLLPGGGMSLEFADLDLNVKITKGLLMQKWKNTLSAYHALRLKNILPIRMTVGRDSRVFIYESRKLQKSESGINLRELVRRTRVEKPRVR